MASNRKLQAEIDRVLKKIQEGITEFGQTWEKVQSAATPNLKEKYEADLKKEIKKLQRYRDQIKSWAGASEVKNKRPLLEARRNIELEMERFKVLEKETKTKAYSKEGLSQSARRNVDPRDDPNYETYCYIDEMMEKLQAQQEEIEEMQQNLVNAKRRSKAQQDSLTQIQARLDQHAWHADKLSEVKDRLSEDEITAEMFEEVKDHLEYYIDSNHEPDFFFDELIYDILDEERSDEDQPEPEPEPEPQPTKKELEALAKIERDNKKKAAKAAKAAEQREKEQREAAARERERKQREKEAADKEAAEREAAMRAERERKAAAARAKANKTSISSKTSTKGSSRQARVPTPVEVKEPETGGATLASIIKSNQERHRASSNSAPSPEEHKSNAPESHHPGQQAFSQQGHTDRVTPPPGLAGPPGLAHPAIHGHHGGQSGRGSPMMHGNNGPAGGFSGYAAQGAFPHGQRRPSAAADAVSARAAMLDASLSASMGEGFADNVAARAAAAAVADEYAYTLKLLEPSLRHMPEVHDTERKNKYEPRNPFPIPPYFPAERARVFDDPAIFEKFNVDTLFFIFYFQQGTPHQYLAARELKKKSWRYHKALFQWFQRHDDPQKTVETYEQGTYLFFDYANTWTQQIQENFTFEYLHLEDELFVPQTNL